MALVGSGLSSGIAILMRCMALRAVRSQAGNGFMIGVELHTYPPITSHAGNRKRVSQPMIHLVCQPALIDIMRARSAFRQNSI